MKPSEEKSGYVKSGAYAIAPLFAILLASTLPNPIERWLSGLAVTDPACAAAVLAGAIGVVLLAVLLLPIALSKRAPSGQ
jgi:hypothetical protein